MGNLSNEKLVDIWFGQKLINLRRNLIHNLNHKIKLCKDCDMLYQKDIFHVPRNMLGMGRSIVGKYHTVAFIEKLIRKWQLLR